MENRLNLIFRTPELYLVWKAFKHCCCCSCYCSSFCCCSCCCCCCRCCCCRCCFFLVSFYFYVSLNSKIKIRTTSERRQVPIISCYTRPPANVAMISVDALRQKKNASRRWPKNLNANFVCLFENLFACWGGGWLFVCLLGCLFFVSLCFGGQGLR